MANMDNSEPALKLEMKEPLQQDKAEVVSVNPRWTFLWPGKLYSLTTLLISIYIGVFCLMHIWAWNTGQTYASLLAKCYYSTLADLTNGEWYRFFVALLVHHSIWHLFSSLLAFVAIGFDCENFVGLRKYALFLGIGCIVGNMGALAAQQKPFLPVAGPDAGLIVAMLCVLFHYTAIMQPKEWKYAPVIILCCLGPPVLYLMNDNQAKIACGLICGFVIGMEWREARLSSYRKGCLVWVTRVLGGLFFLRILALLGKENGIKGKVVWVRRQRFGDI